MIQKIKVTANYPNQSINFFANNQNFTLILRWTGYLNEGDYYDSFLYDYARPQFFGSIFLNNVAIIQSTNVINKTPINAYASAINGYIVAVDISGNNENPSLDNIGVTVFFYYIDQLSEINNITASS